MRTRSCATMRQHGRSHTLVKTCTTLRTHSPSHVDPPERTAQSPARSSPSPRRTLCACTRQSCAHYAQLSLSTSSLLSPRRRPLRTAPSPRRPLRARHHPPGAALPPRDAKQSIDSAPPQSSTHAGDSDTRHTHLTESGQTHCACTPGDTLRIRRATERVECALPPG